MIKFALLIISLLVINDAQSRSAPYTWNKLKSETDLVVKGMVISAELVVDLEKVIPFGAFPTIKLEILVDDVIYSRKEKYKKTKRKTLYLTGYKNHTPVGTYGTYFLSCEKKCMVVDEPNGVWPIKTVYTGKLGEEYKNELSIYESKHLYIARLPNILKTEHHEWVYSEKHGDIQLTKKTFITTETLSKQLPMLLK